MRSIALVFLTAIVLTACGGGGSGDPPQADGVVVVSPSPSASPSPTPTPTPTPTPSTQPSGSDLIFGVNGHPFTAYPDITMEQQLDLLVQLGAKQYRVNVGETQLDGLDRLLPLATARGITVLPMLAPTVDFDRDTAEQIYARARTLGEQTGRRFAGRIKVWELGNELENYAIIKPCEVMDNGQVYSCSFGMGIGNNVLDYVGARWRKVSAALDGLSDGMKAGDPTASRAIGTAGWGHTHAFDRLRTDGVEWDISIWHQYQPNHDQQMTHVAAFGKPIWITEFNHGDTVEKTDAENTIAITAMVDHFRAVRAQYKIEAVFFYELLDEPYWSGFEAKSGLVRLEKGADGKWKLGALKPQFNAIKARIAAGP